MTFIFSCKNIIVIDFSVLKKYKNLEKFIRKTKISLINSMIYFIFEEKNAKIKQVNPVGAAVYNYNFKKIEIYNPSLKIIIYKILLENILSTIDDINNVVLILENLFPDLVYLLQSLNFSNVQILNDKYHIYYSENQTGNLLNFYFSNKKLHNPTIQNIRLLINKEFCNKLFPYLDLNYEVGGKLLLQYSEKNLGVLRFCENCIEKGTEFDVDIKEKNLSLFSFHTHPYQCYQKLLTQFGWASSQDLNMIINNFLNNNNILLHLIVSKEGIWFINLTVDFQSLLFNIKNFYDEFIIKCTENMKENFTKITKISEFFRTERLDFEIKPTILNDYKIFINTLQLSDILTIEECKIKDKNIFLFNIELLSWKNILDGENFFFTINYIYDPKGGFNWFIEEDEVFSKMEID
jgi:hypothetical protein